MAKAPPSPPTAAVYLEQQESLSKNAATLLNLSVSPKGKP